MDLYIWGAIRLISMAALCFGVWRTPDLKVKIALILIMLALGSGLNPIRFKPEEMANVESVRKSDAVKIPARISVEEVSYEDRTNQEMDKMKSISKEIQNEINN